MIAINSALFYTLMKNRFGSMLNLEVEWRSRVEQGIQQKGTARDKSTIGKWVKTAGFPAQEDAIFGLSATLDVDPIALLDINEEFVKITFPRERILIQLMKSHKTPLKSLHPLFLPAWRWPNNKLLHRYFNRDWFTQEYSYDPDNTLEGFAAFHMIAKDRGPSPVPRVYHFAYKVKGARDGLWRPYGIVLGYDGRNQLIHERGDYFETNDPRSADNVVAQTYFGPAATYFKISSVHDFNLQVGNPSKETEAVCFR